MKIIEGRFQAFVESLGFLALTDREEELLRRTFFSGVVASLAELEGSAKARDGRSVSVRLGAMKAECMAYVEVQIARRN